MFLILANASNNLPSFIKEPKDNKHVIEAKDASELFSFSNSFESWIGPIYNVGINILTILFVAATISMAFAFITKTGQWMKWASGTMVMSFIVLLILRIGPIIFLTTSVVGFTLIVSDFVSLLTKISFWAAIGMILVGLYIRLLHKVVSEHPEYFRWSKNLFVGALVLGLLSGVIPLLFKVV